MERYVAFLRAVNVGGTGKLPMPQLKSMCEECAFENVRTYIASGNVIFESELSKIHIKKILENKLEAFAGKKVGIVLHTGNELLQILESNPFPKAQPNQVIVFLFDNTLSPSILDDVSNQKSEELRLIDNTLFVHYPEGQGSSKLKISATKNGTGRNLNTIRKLADMAKE